MVSESELTKILEENPPHGEFTPYCRVDEMADTLTVYFENVADYSERLTDHVTLYRSIETKDVVGCRIKGISGVIADLPNYININHGGIELNMLFFAYRGEAEDSAIINDLAKTAADKNMKLEYCS